MMVLSVWLCLNKISGTVTESISQLQIGKNILIISFYLRKSNCVIIEENYVVFFVCRGTFWHSIFNVVYYLIPVQYRAYCCILKFL